MKKIQSTILAGLLGLSAFSPGAVFAAEGLKLDVKLYLNGAALSNVPMELYFVAAGEQEESQLQDGFLAFAPNLEDLDFNTAGDIQALAGELSEYLEEYPTEPLEIITTNQNGEANFTNLTSGLYFIPRSEFTLNGELMTTESIVLWLEEDTVAYPKGQPANTPGSGTDIPGTTPTEPETSVPQVPNKPGSSPGTNNSTGVDIGNSAVDPTFSAPVNTGTESNLVLYLVLFAGAVLSLVGLGTALKRKNDKSF